MSDSFLEDKYVVINNESIVINTIVVDPSSTDEEIQTLLSSIGEDLLFLKLSEIQKTTVGVGFQYSDGNFIPPNPEPDTSSYAYDSETNSWIPSIPYPENEPEGKYLYQSGQWVLDLAFKIV
jgi:hypothetical protein